MVRDRSSPGLILPVGSDSPGHDAHLLRDNHRPAPAIPFTSRPLSRLTGKWRLAYGLRVADVYRALADPTRRAILDELTDRNGQTLFEICSRLAMKHGLSSSRQAISQHLDVLESAGLVKTKRDGRYKFHFIDATPLKSIGERWPIDD